MRSSTLLTAFGLTFAAVLLLLPRAAEAGGVVGGGNPASCDEAALNARLAGGGMVTFDCGLNPVNIMLSSQKVITLATTLDGGSAVTLTGTYSTSLFQVNFGAGLSLKNIRLANGQSGTGDNSGCPPADQRGIPRIGNCDIAAFESFYRLYLVILKK